ncbi:hypothetical protein [Halostagnicola sp. A56]|uniref:hypothetical protein n=1 Tax=Halostagnicola sp. A56 TaxID=1495067 RepID=UPI0012E14882|nr:hypothetical protein [Halostagnicola sp. A56]
MIASIDVIASIGGIAATQRTEALERRLGRGIEASHRTAERTVSGGVRDGC